MPVPTDGGAYRSLGACKGSACVTRETTSRDDDDDDDAGVGEDDDAGVLARKPRDGRLGRPSRRGVKDEMDPGGGRVHPRAARSSRAARNGHDDDDDDDGRATRPREGSVEEEEKEEAETELNAWGIPVRRYTEEDIVRQKFVETIHRVEWRDRRGGRFRNPDDVDELRWNESDDENDEMELVKIIRRIEAENDGAQDEDEGTSSARDVVGDSARAETEDVTRRNREPGAYQTLLFRDRATAADATAEERAQYFETRMKNMRGVPPDLHRFVKPVAIELPIGSRVKKVSGGDDHALILLESDPEVLEVIDPTYTEHEGRVLVMGSDEFSQLGLSTSTAQDIPVALDTLGEARAADIAAGAKHSVVVTLAQECATWGKDTSGCTGHGLSGTNRTHDVPRWMYWMTNATTKVVSCAAGDAHTFLKTASGHVYSFGSGTYGQLGHGDGETCAKPKLVEPIYKLNVSSIACGGNSTLILTNDGLVYGCGSNSHGQLGSGDFTSVFLPRRLAHNELVGGVPTTIDIKELYMDSHDIERRFVEEMAALTVKGDSKTRTTENIQSKVIQVTMGKAHTVLLSERGRVYVCGRGDRGQLGLGTTENQCSVTLVSSIVNVRISQIAAGEAHTVMMTTLGDVFVCGSNDFGQLGDGSVKSCSVPQKMQPTISMTDRVALKKSEIDDLLRHPLYGIQAKQVYASKSSTFIVTQDSNTLYICGSGAFGHPMNTTPTNLSALTQEPLTKWNETQVLVMGSTFANLKLDEHIFNNLVKQMVMYGPYPEHVLAHVFKTGFEEILLHPHMCSVYVNMINAIDKHSKGCTSLSFRRVIMHGIEDIGVRLLKCRNEAQRRRLLSHLGPVSFQKLQSRDVKFDLQKKLNSFIMDSAGYEEYELFKSHCVTLNRLVRELEEAKILLAEDLDDMASGFLGSAHSISLIDSVDAGHKVELFKAIANVKKKAKGALEVDRHTGNMRTKERVPDLLSTAAEEASWGSATYGREHPNTWKVYKENSLKERELKALTHGITAEGKKSGNKVDVDAESMLSASTRAVRRVKIADGPMKDLHQTSRTSSVADIVRRLRQKQYTSEYF